jgi:hypothetical protein
MAKGREVTIRIAGVVFDDFSYDEAQDALHLSVADGAPAAWTEESAEGHTLRYASNGALVSMTLCDVRLELVRNGGVTITPPRRYLERSDLEDVL